MINYLPLDALIINERQRSVFAEKPLEELKESILTLGLLHAPVVKSDGRTLLIGERRVRAIQALAEEGKTIVYAGDPVPLHSIPCIIASNLDDPILAFEAELDENIKREDLSWQERAQALSRLSEIRKEQNPEQTVAKTAEELISAIGKGALSTVRKEVSDSIRIAEHLDDPEIAAATSLREATKLLEKKAMKKQREELAKQYKLEDENMQVFQQDAIEFLRESPSSFYDGIITDPPYGIDASNFGPQSSLRHEYEDSQDYAEYCYAQLFDEGFRITKPNAFLYAFCDVRLFEMWKACARVVGWEVFDWPLIWDRGNSGLLPRPHNGPRRCYEAILYAWKGDRPFHIVAPRDIISIPAVANPTFGAEKPAALYETLLSWIAQPNDRILDPFAGSGPVFPAGKKLMCRVTGVEMMGDKVDFIKKRIMDNA